MNKKYLIIVSSFFFTMIFVFSLMSWASSLMAVERVEEEVTTAPPPPPPIPQIPEKTLTYTVKKGDVLGKILPQFDLNTHEIHTAAKDIFDLANIRIGKQFEFLQVGDEITEVRYALGIDETLIVEKKEGAWVARKQVIRYDNKQSLKSFSVESSFWKAASDAGLQARDISSLVQLFEYDVDFNTEIRAGDKATLLIEELYKDGQFVRLAAPLAVRFQNQKRSFTAIRFKDKEGRVLYYDEKGVSRKGAFLRSPLAFSRVTSSFNPKRFHPILKKPRPHNGTDFGAPTGTPVRAAADGKVVFASTNRGHGKFVKIKHSQGYQTSYSHLSKIHVRRGDRVRQGETIGKVGTTGLSTGPHLHYQMWKNGKFVDAMKEKLPKTQKVPRAEMANFKSIRDRYLQELQGASPESN
ncbi:MAG: peptidoglycan DD-metalloendopeptidase family protein [Myxococcota bacterium]|nr:peptidoglycan DD-metalloendopeptidase family protein [Myxococcota bacterium]